MDLKLAGEFLVVTTAGDEGLSTVYGTLLEVQRAKRVIIMHAEETDVVPWWELDEAEQIDVGIRSYSTGDLLINGDHEAPDYVRYRNDVYPLTDFSSDWGITRGTGLPAWAKGWHGYLSTDFESGVLLRWNPCDRYGCDDREPDFTGESGVTLATFII